jgi:hypothetical protein
MMSMDATHVHAEGGKEHGKIKGKTALEICHNLSFGLVTKAKACKVMGQKGGSGITSLIPGNAKSARE